jgi:hypothetical protein
MIDLICIGSRGPFPSALIFYLFIIAAFRPFDPFGSFLAPTDWQICLGPDN